MSSKAVQKWRFTDESVLWEQWGDEYAIFHGPSGKTHFLNTSGALVLRLLAQKEFDVTGIADEIRTRTGAPFDEALLQQLENVLLRFEQLGLVSRIHSLDPVTP